MNEKEIKKIQKMYEGINWENIKVGDKLQYEEKYYLQAEVTVLDKQILEGEHYDEEFEQNIIYDKYCRIELQIDKVIGGMLKNYKPGDTLTVGKSLTEGQYLTNGIKFKEIGSSLEYICN